MDIDWDSLLVRSVLGTIAVVTTMISYSLLSSFIVNPLVSQLGTEIQARFGPYTPAVVFLLAALLSVPAGILVGLAAKKD